MHERRRCVTVVPQQLAKRRMAPRHDVRRLRNIAPDLLEAQHPGFGTVVRPVRSARRSTAVRSRRCRSRKELSKSSERGGGPGLRPRRAGDVVPGHAPVEVRDGGRRRDRDVLGAAEETSSGVRPFQPLWARAVLYQRTKSEARSQPLGRKVVVHGDGTRERQVWGPSTPTAPRGSRRSGRAGTSASSVARAWSSSRVTCCRDGSTAGPRSPSRSPSRSRSGPCSA